jgi:outer membrane protein assembly factor BamE (lipoprotein component of BamABCDE complex)
MSAIKSVSLVAAATAFALASSAIVVSTPALALGASSTAPAFSQSILVRAHGVSESAILNVQPGMTRDAISALFGSPVRTMRFPLSRTTAWDYDFVDSWGYASEFSVIFDDGGIVVGKVTSRNDY